MKIPVTMQVQIAVGVLAVGVVAYAVWKASNALKKMPDNPQGAAESAARALLDAAAADFKRAIGIAEGSVVGVGQSVGIPKTSVMLCTQAQVKGDGFAVSQYCTAAEYLSWQAGKVGQDISDWWNDLFDSGKVDFVGGGGKFSGHGASGSW